jgi:cyanate permease
MTAKSLTIVNIVFIIAAVLFVCFGGSWQLAIDYWILSCFVSVFCWMFD